MAEFKYKAFISYSHADEKWARWSHRALESYKPPKHLIGTETRMGNHGINTVGFQPTSFLPNGGQD
ncbi:MAG: TIR domain-containing protein [Gammaproteobacteria bacterium]|nr:TIR domain-containing protein [Gammaproteobacteria bacterium]